MPFRYSQYPSEYHVWPDARLATDERLAAGREAGQSLASETQVRQDRYLKDEGMMKSEYHATAAAVVAANFGVQTYGAAC